MAPETSFFQNPGYKRSWTDVPLEGDKISTKEFIEACESLTVIFEYLSAAFSVVSKDLNGNITKIRTRYEEAPSESAYIQDLVINELKTKKHTATEGLLWLTRGLQFMSIALNKNIQSETEELSVSFKDAYGPTLKPHHSFVIKPVFSAAMSACPYRKDFYASVSKGEDAGKFKEQMGTYLQSLEKIVNILKPFTESKEAKW